MRYRGRSPLDTLNRQLADENRRERERVFGRRPDVRRCGACDEERTDCSTLVTFDQHGEPVPIVRCARCRSEGR